MKAGLLLVFVAACVAMASAQLGFDGPQCPVTLSDIGSTCRFSSECQCGKQEVDFVFEFDTSGSMCSKLTSVKSGLARFAQSLEAAGTVDFRFVLIKFGGTPTWMTPWTTNITFLITVINTLNCNDSGQESGLEMLRMVHGAASDMSIRYSSYVPVDQRDFSFRPGALIYHVMTTDEDSDCPTLSGNRFSDANGVAECRSSRGSSWFEPPNCNFTTSTGTEWYTNSSAPFWLERQNTSSILINARAAFAGWVNPNRQPCVLFQYGPVQYQVGNLTYFNASATIANVLSQSYPANMSIYSLQMQMLLNNLTARVYDIALINTTGSIDSFFDNIVASVTCGGISTCNCGRQDQCIDGVCVTNPTMSCTPFANCPSNTFCQINATACAADGQAEPGYYPSTTCLTCHPYLDNTDFTSSCTTSDICYSPICQLNKTCALIPLNTTSCTCLVNGTVYFKGAQDPLNASLICDPRYGTFVDPNNPPYDCSTCPASTECEIVTCSATDGCITTLANTTNCVCNIGGTQYRVNDLNPTDPGQQCDPQINPNGWTDRASIAICSNFTDCGSCLFQSNACGWCGAIERCVAGLPQGPAANTSACAYHWIFTNSEVTGQNFTEADHNPTLQNPIQPASMDVFLRPGVPLTVTVQVRRPPVPPLDFYMLVDSSASMGQFVDLVKNSSIAIAARLRSIQNNTALGLGTFLDKPIQPRGFWPWCFVYRNLVSMSLNDTNFATGINNFQVTYNYDQPEGSLEGLMMAAWDASGEIGWRPDSYKVVMICTDTHSYEPTTDLAGDIGNLPPNNGDGIMDGNPPGTGENYPTRAQVANALVQTKVLPIFAAIQNETDYYTGVTDFFTFGAVVPFESSNQTQMIDGIENGILKNIEKMVLAVQSDPMTRVVRITPSQGYTGAQDGDIHEFDITLMAAEGADDYTNDSTVVLSFVGWPYTVSINVKTYVHCQNCDNVTDTLRFDQCNICGGNNTICRGCDGLLWSNLTTDICGVCNGDGTGCLDCAGVPNGNSSIDLCGVCGGNSSSCAGCDGIPNSGTVVDDCGECGGSNNCNAVTTGVAVASAFAAVAAAFAIAAVIFFFLTRAKMMAVDTMLSKQLAAVRSNPLYQSKFKARENPLYRKDNSVEMSDKSDKE